MEIAGCPRNAGEYYARIYGKRRMMMTTKRLILESAIIGLLLVMVFKCASRTGS